MHIALLYCGVLMGAGFASGKELWQFFGIFGKKGMYGILLVSFLFVLIGRFIVGISKSLNTADLAKLILPVDHPLGEKLVSIVVSAFLFMAYFSMLAAGGALGHEVFGLPRAFAGLVLMLIVVWTAIHGFLRVSDRLGKTTPVLIFFTLLISIFVIVRGMDQISWTEANGGGPLSGHWLLSAILFLSYNMMGAIPILGNCTIHEEKPGSAKVGSVLGGLFLGLIASILYFATLTNPLQSQAQPLPLLTLSASLGFFLKPLFAVVLLISIFGTATSCFYGFTTKLPNSKSRHRQIWMYALFGYGVSMIGFSNIVAFLYPLEGYLGIIFLLLLIWNYVRIKMGKRGNIHDQRN